MPVGKLDRGVKAPTVLETDGADPLTPLGLGSFRAGDAIVIRPRNTLRIFDATTAPAASTQEGPYLRIRPTIGALAVGLAQDEGADCNPSAKAIYKWGNESIVGAAGTLSPPPSYVSNDFFYEVDAFGPTFVLPFDASLEIVTGYSGTFAIDAFRMPERPIPPVQELHQTRQFRSGGNRSIPVPMGTREYMVVSAGNTTTFLASEETAKAVAGGTSFTGDQIFTGYGPTWRSVGNARRINTSAPSNDGLVIFKIIL